MKYPAAFHVAMVIASATTAGAAVVSAQGRGQGGMQAAASADPHNISGYWELSFDSRSVPPANLASGVTKADLDEVAKKDANTVRWCQYLGLQFAMDSGRPLNIRQGQSEILMVPEGLASPRHLYLHRTAHVNLKIFDPTTSGDSIAHWDGDTLVVDTIGFAGDRGILATPGGGFRTDNSHLIERYRLIKNGSALSVTFTWDDPQVFQTPHTYEFRYSRVTGKYDPRPALGCDPWDDDRTKFVSTVPPAVIH